MEADWEFEIGPGAPIIDAAWPGFVDLRLDPDRAAKIAEAARFTGLAQALVRLNAPASPVFTSKCDVWIPDDFDIDELDALAADCLHAHACYIDILPASGELEFSTPAWVPRDPPALFGPETSNARADDSPISTSALASAESSCRNLCATLHAVRLRNCRVDLVIRRALISPTQETLGVTAYLTACGATPASAAAGLSAALAAFAQVLVPQSLPDDPKSKVK